MIPQLETPRLILRPLALTDIDQTQRIFPHWEVVRWMLRLKSSPATQHVGCISLMKRANDNRGFWLGLAWQRQGLMSEAAIAVTDFWFNTLGQPEMHVAKAVANSASRRISEKNGMRIVAHEERDYVSGRLSTEIWCITAEEWRDRAPELVANWILPRSN